MTTMTISPTLSPTRPLLGGEPTGHRAAPRRRTGALLLAGVTAVVAVSIAAVPAGPSSVGDTLARSGVLADQVFTATLGSEGLAATVGPAQVELPLRAGDAVTLTSDEGVLRVGLPVSDGTATGSLMSSGTLVYSDPDLDRSVAAQIVEDGARALVVLNSAQSPTSFTFPLSLPAGVSAVDDGAGGFDLVRADGPTGAGIAIGTIAAPWARDAAGRSVPTSYTLRGTDLVQTVLPGADATYPIVADPKYTWGWVTGTVYYNRAETRSMKTVTYGTVAAAGLCAAFGPQTAGAACAISGALIAQWHYVAGNAYGDGKCVKIKVPLFWAYAYQNDYCR